MTDSKGDIRWADCLAERESQGLRRSLRLIQSPQGRVIRSQGRALCNFASNDYLGMANHPAIRSAVKRAVDDWGWGAGASRLVAGHMEPHRDLERLLAEFKDAEAALVCPTGYQANLAAIRGLAGSGDCVFIDKLDHASIIDGAFAGGPAGLYASMVRTFPHRDYDRLEKLLERAGEAGSRVILTDSVFSMDGDVADLARLVELKRRYDAVLCVDEAHATGVIGDRGRGVAELQGVEREIDVTVGTLSKALGGVGGFVAGRAAFIEWLVNTARSFIYTTAIPPAACMAAATALDIVAGEPERRHRLLAMAERLRTELTERGFDTGDSTTQIIPIILGDADTAVEVSRSLEAAGYFVPAMRPPTVPPGTARLRISLTAAHTENDLQGLLEALDHAPRATPPGDRKTCRS